MLHSRWRRATMAAVASLCAAAAVAPSALAAPGDLPDLAQQAPTGITMGHYDDHSRGGDNHMGWSFSGSDGEPIAIRFQATLRNAGPGVLQLCAGNGDGIWRALRQTAPGALGDCSGATQNTAGLWSRYATANHSDDNTFNRWHVMDLQRFALVPLAGQNGPAAGNRRTIWDSQWGTCLLDDGGMACPQNASATSFNVGISANRDKLTQEGAPDQAVIAFRDLEQVPSGYYQVVAMANPYGVYREAGNGTGSVSCTTVQITSNPDAGTFSLQQVAAAPAQCWLPRNLQSRVTGPTGGGVDPFAGAAADGNTCMRHMVDDPADPDDITGHCWMYIPTINDPADLLAPHPPARTNITDARATSATNAVPVAQGATINVPANPGNPGNGGSTPATPPAATPRVTPPAVTPPVVTPPTNKAVPTMSARRGRSYVRTALRRTFRVLPQSASVSCRLTGGATASCNVSWRRPKGVRYRGTVRVWFASDAQQVRWNYGMDVKRTKRGAKTRTTSRSERQGGVLA
jgi:hypothetical protein